jgi:hypothetical protein
MIAGKQSDVLRLDLKGKESEGNIFQLIVSHDEIIDGMSGTTAISLTGMGLHVNKPRNDVSMKYELFMRHVRIPAFSQNGWETFHDSEMVASSVMHVAEGWNMLFFSKPFVYNGTDHLLVELRCHAQRDDANLELTASPMPHVRMMQQWKPGYASSPEFAASDIRPDILLVSDKESNVIFGKYQNDSHASNLKIWPNPASENIRGSFHSGVSGDAELSLTDLQGRQLYQTAWQLNEGENPFVIRTDEIQQLTHGVYIVGVRHAGAFFTGRVVLSK